MIVLVAGTVHGDSDRTTAVDVPVVDEPRDHAAVHDSLNSPDCTSPCVGEVWPVEMRAPTQVEKRQLRSETKLKEEGRLLSQKLKKGEMIAIELAYGDKHSHNEPWVICRVERKVHTYQGPTLEHTKDKMDSAWMGQVKNNDQVLWCTKLEPHSTGGRECLHSD